MADHEDPIRNIDHAKKQIEQLQQQLEENERKLEALERAGHAMDNAIERVKKRTLTQLDLVRGHRVIDTESGSIVSERVEELEAETLKGDDGREIVVTKNLSLSTPTFYVVTDDPNEPALLIETFLVDPDTNEILHSMGKSCGPRLDSELPPEPVHDTTHVLKYKPGAKVPPAFILPQEATDSILQALGRSDDAAKSDFDQRTEHSESPW